jgi:hypothetical protein
MGKFAETANVDYCLLFAEQGKQTSVCRKQTEVCHFHFPFAANISCPFLLVLFSVYLLKGQHIYRYIYTVDTCAAVPKGKRKPRQFFLIPLRVLIVQTEVCHLPVCLRRNKRKLSICKRTCPSMELGSSDHDIEAWK